MNCQQLAQRISELQPELSPIGVARLSLLVLSQHHDLHSLHSDDSLAAACNSAAFRLEAASDQQAAVAAELDSMCGDTAVRFSPEQIWTLLRAVKVQSQIIDLYTRQAVTS